MTHEPSPANPSNTGSKRSVLLIGLAPHVVDFSKVPGLDEAKLKAGIQAGLEEIVAAGFDASWCLTDSTWEKVEPQVSAALAEKRYDAIMIGAGIRTIPEHFLLFERVINLVHGAAPGAKLCFNTSPDTTLAALRRWIEP
jgi:hypothetical protein